MKRAKTIMLAVLAVLVVALGAAAGLLGYRISGLRRYQEQLSLGEKYLAELDYENAEICFQKAIEINEKRVASYVQLSVVYVKQQRYSEAREMLEKAAEYADPRKTEVQEQVQEQLDVVEQREEKQQAEERQAETEEAFDAYLRDTLIPQKGLGELSSVEGWMYSYDDSWYEPLGILTAYLEDLDSDGELEMLVLSLEKSQKDTENYPKGENLVGEVYELVDGQVQLAVTQILMEYNESPNPQPCTFLLSQSSEISLHVSRVTVEGRNYLFFERGEMGMLFADGGTRDYWMVVYEDGQLSTEVSFTQPGMGSAQFRYMGYRLSGGQVIDRQLLYSEDMDQGPGVYGSFQEAVSEFFEEVGVQAAYSDPSQSILTEENQLERILDYHTAMVQRSASGSGGKYRLEAVDHMELRQRLGMASDREEAQEPESQAWKEQYLEHISEIENEMPYVEYQLIYLDDDDIPELVMDFGSTAAGGEICTYREGEISAQHIYNYGLSYIEKGNICREEGGHMGDYYDKIYVLNENREFQQIAEGTSREVWGNGTPKLDENGQVLLEYTWNGQEVTREEYESSLRSVMDIGSASNPYDNMVDKEQITRRIQEI